MRKRVAIVQSNYIPWKGYFDLIGNVDEFIFYDDVQFTKNDWRNRNKIKTPNGIEWITVPVEQNIHKKIYEIKITSEIWRQKHWNTLTANYARSMFFREISELLKPLYFGEKYIYISDANIAFIRLISEYLKIPTKFSNSFDYNSCGGKSERLVDLCKQAGATCYVSGPSARAYLDENLFREADIKLIWFGYDGYPSYCQLWGDFVHQVSILDLLYNCGPKAPDYMRLSRC